MNISTDQRGVALFLTVLVMGTVAISVLLGLTQGSINAIADSNEQTHALAARATAFGCLEEVFIQLVGDSTWSEASVVTPDTTCAVTFAPNGETTDVLVIATSGSITRGVTANLTRDPLIINDLEEALSL